MCTFLPFDVRGISSSLSTSADSLVLSPLLVFIMNIASPLNANFNSDSTICNFKIRKRSILHEVETTSRRNNKKAFKMSETTTHKRKDVPIAMGGSVKDITMQDQNSKLTHISSPSMLMHDKDSTTISHPSSNSTTATNNNTDWVELQLEFLRTLKKLNKSMHRTDQSREFYIRSLRRYYQSARTLGKDRYHPSDHHNNELRYFTTPDFYQSLQIRQEFAKMVHHDCLYRTAF